ncbi:MAG: hypothetical protein Q9159_003763 [Coniocarpon cinnabarinum]
MTRPRRGRHAPKSLSSGRPCGLRKQGSASSSLSASKSRQLIRRHHELSKNHAQALAAGDKQRAAEITAEIEAQGGLVRYQQASKTGQSAQRGGDSSKVLMEWLACSTEDAQSRIGGKRAMLEVGALSTDNACSKSEMFQMTRIDLNAQSDGIIKQDFVQRPLPRNDEHCFDCVSLSLVLNFVPDAIARGEMLRRTTQFLRRDTHHARVSLDEGQMRMFPSLFLVVPAPCVANSRYLDEERLTEIMRNLGFQVRHRKLTAKLAYYLWILVEKPSEHASFPKSEIRKGGSRNNFAIVLK